MEIQQLLGGVELFDGLSEDNLIEIAKLCSYRQLKEGEYLVKQGDFGRELFIVNEGVLEISVQRGTKPHVIINLGYGQLIGEMSLVDHGPRSASVKAIQEPTSIQVIKNKDFLELCQRNTQIGYRVMLNLAADLSFKLRHSNLSEL